ncbi:MAG: hypothetical protein RL701_5997 [Pseudomonadota bacterium]|jgi:hypothetical protein
MATVDFRIDPLTDDLAISPTGRISITDTIGSDTTQRLRCKLRWFLGEWFAGINLGFPYFRDALIKVPNIASMRSAFATVITSDRGVSRLQELELVREDRNLRVTFTAILVSGELLDDDIAISVLASEGDLLTLDEGELLSP